MGSLFDSRRMVRVQIHVEPEQREAVRRMAKRAGDGVTPSKVYRAAIREGLAVLERRMRKAEGGEGT